MAIEDDYDFLRYFENKQYNIATGIFAAQTLALLKLRRSRYINTAASLFLIIPAYDFSKVLSYLYVSNDFRKHLKDLDSSSVIRKAIDSRNEMPIILNNTLSTSLKLSSEEKRAYIDHVERLTIKKYIAGAVSLTLASIFALYRKYPPISSSLMIAACGYIAMSRSEHIKQVAELSQFMKELPEESSLKQILMGNEETIQQILSKKKS